jgi:CDGSH-type Zn-finger protein
MQQDPVIAQASPYKVELEKGKKYAWCQCGLSKKQPFCDGAHKGTDFTPVVYEAKESGDHYLCGCKHTKNQPLCDGSHSELEQD